MLITDEQRTALVKLIEIAATGRALQHEHDHPTRAPELQELVRRHQELGDQKTAAAEVVETHRGEISGASALIEKQKTQVAKKTAELNDGTGLTSRDLVNLQTEIAGHEDRIAELEETELAAMERLEAAEAAVAEVEATLAEVTDAGRSVQTALKERKAELADLIEDNDQEAGRLKSALPGQLVATFETNIAQGGPGAAILTGPNCQACGQQIGGAAWNAMLGENVNETYECEECEAVLLRRS